MTLFQNKKIRNAFDNTSKKFLFSVVDICAAIRDTDYTTGRNYWKWLKNKLYNQNNPMAKNYKQLKFEALDGKLRYTDVMDAEEILQLIQVFPSPKAEAFRQWIGELVVAGVDVVEALTEACCKAKDEIRRRVGGFMQTISRRKFDLTAPEDTVDSVPEMLDYFARVA